MILPWVVGWGRGLVRIFYQPNLMRPGEEAIAYARKKGLMYVVDEPAERAPVRKAYADNFRYKRLFPWTH